jgi:hypothetical protein
MNKFPVTVSWKSGNNPSVFLHDFVLSAMVVTLGAAGAAAIGFFLVAQEATTKKAKVIKEILRIFIICYLSKCAFLS